jgi:hypothetical protein
LTSIALVVPAVVFGLAVWQLGFGTVSQTLPYVAAAVVILVLLLSCRLRGVRPSVWMVAIKSGTAFFYCWVLFSLDARWYEKGALLVIVGPILAWTANAAGRADRRREQRRKDRFAERALVRVNETDATTPMFALYLRPFGSTDRLEAQVDSDPGAVAAHLDAEALLARALRKECPLVALGRPGEVVEGAGRIEASEGDWKDTITALAACASFQIILPSSHAGTFWELERIARCGQLGKTLFFMPESLGKPPSGVVSTTESDGLFGSGVRSYDPARHSYDRRAEWVKARESGESLGLHLPPWAPAGAMFVLDPATGSVSRAAPLALATLARRPWYLRAAIHHLGLLPSTANLGTDVLDAFTRAVFFRGRTLEYALTVAANLYFIWAELETAAELLRQATLAGGRNPSFSRGYIDSLDAPNLETLADLMDVGKARELAAIMRRSP